MTPSEELLDLSKKLADTADQLKELAGPLDDLEYAAEHVAKSWSGSWLGYHSRVYYKDFEPPPPGARFSQEWGFMDTWSIPGTQGEWGEYDYDYVIAAIKKDADDPDLDSLKERAKGIAEFFEDARSSVRSILAREFEQRPKDSFLEDLQDNVEKKKIFRATDFIEAWGPTGQVMSRDILAIEKGFHTPPHLEIMATVGAIRHPFVACGELGKLARRAGSHLAKLSERKRDSDRIGTNIFIGHGRSKVWRDLKDFVQDRLRLPWDEFNRVPVAGVTNIARLSQMLDDSAFAFLVLTAEDEQADGKMHARMNVLHEAGLFQGRLGFGRAIILLEDGCEEFSNIQGLGQIRFPAGSITAVFEEIRRVLEREELIPESKN